MGEGNRFYCCLPLCLPKSTLIFSLISIMIVIPTNFMTAALTMSCHIAYTCKNKNQHNFKTPNLLLFSVLNSDSATPNQLPRPGADSADDVFMPRTPGSILRGNDSGTRKKPSRTKSMSVSFTPAAMTPHNNRCSLLLRHMSPEEG